jgi:hypothetical protein
LDIMAAERDTPAAQEVAMATEAKLLMIQFLDWVEARPRTLSETRAAWSSTCPLNCAWEDAISDDLVAGGRDGSVKLTARGRARLADARLPAAAAP